MEIGIWEERGERGLEGLGREGELGREGDMERAVDGKMGRVM